MPPIGAAPPICRCRRDSLFIQNSGTANLDSYFTANELFLGQGATNNGTLNQTNGALRLTGQIAIGDAAGTGELKMSGGLICTNSFLDLGRWNGSNGTLTMTGGNLYAYDWVAFGDSWQGPPTANGNGILTGTARLTTFSVLTIGGSEYGLGSLTLGTAGGADAPVVASATMNIANGGTGTLTLNTGSNVVTGATTIANGLTGTSGTLELNGGTYATSGITAGATGATPTITFNGGTIKATASGTLLSGSTLALKVQTASAKIDSNSFDVVASAPFINDGVGGLTKTGARLADLRRRGQQLYRRDRGASRKVDLGSRLHVHFRYAERNSGQFRRYDRHRCRLYRDRNSNLQCQRYLQQPLDLGDWRG